MNSLVSVIIPVYNVSLYLRQCIDSVINQTYENIEIILVDDGSSDGSEEICNEYAANNLSIKVIHQKNQGLSAARNTGIENASGDFIYFIDSDDYIDKETIQTLYNHLQNNPKASIAIGYFTAVVNGENKTYKESWLFDSPRTIDSTAFAERMLMEKSNHAATAKLYRRELFNTLRFQLGKKNEDTLFDMDLIPIIEENKYQCVEVPIYTYYYRLHNQSICRSASDPFIWHVVINCETIIDNYPNRLEIVYFLRNKQLDAIISTLSEYIKQGNIRLFYSHHFHIGQFPTAFVKQNRSLKVFCYFLLLKHAPKVLIIREKIRNLF